MQADAMLQPRDFRVLVVDDHPGHRELAGAVFESLGCLVSMAVDGLEAIEAAGLATFDVVLMDRNMPRCGGDRAASSIRAAQGPSSDALIVAHSSDPPVGAQAAPYDVVVGKPLQPHIALQLVKSARLRSDLRAVA